MATWIVDRNGKVTGLRLPDTMGNTRVLSCMEVVGRFTVDQIQDLQARLPKDNPTEHPDEKYLGDGGQYC